MNSSYTKILVKRTDEELLSIPYIISKISFICLCFLLLLTINLKKKANEILEGINIQKGTK